MLWFVDRIFLVHYIYLTSCKAYLFCIKFWISVIASSVTAHVFSEIFSLICSEFIVLVYFHIMKIHTGHRKRIKVSLLYSNIHVYLMTWIHLATHWDLWPTTYFESCFEETRSVYSINSNCCMKTPRDGVLPLICMHSWRESRCMPKRQ